MVRSMSLEFWKSFFEIGGVLLLFLTFVFGAGALVVSTKINERQAEEIRQFDANLKDRTISPEQSAKLISLLRAGPNGPIGIIWDEDVPDSFRLAGNIREVLNASGWLNVTIGKGMVANTKGLTIAVRDSRTAPPYAVFLQKAFTSVGIPLEWEYTANFPTGLVRIEIGHKPKIP